MKTILIPVRSFRSAKRRLGPTLSPQQRESVADAMLRQLLDSLCSGSQLDAAVVTSSPEVASECRARGTEVLFEPESDSMSGNERLNRALTWASDELGRTGRDRVTIAHADLPLIDDEAIRWLANNLALLTETCAAMIPDRHYTGTNLLSLPLPLPFALRFGKDSCAAHQQEAARAECPLQTWRHPAFSTDLDDESDLRAVLDRRSLTPSVRLLRSFLGLANIEPTSATDHQSAGLAT